MSAPEAKKSPILIRIPEHYAIVLDRIVKQSKGRYKSRNELVLEIIGTFVSELKNKAEDEFNG